MNKLGIWAIAAAFVISMITIPAFAQMESMRIEGNHNPLVNTMFSVKIIVEGTSRASYGDFSASVTVYEKETGKEIAGIPRYLITGTNSVPFNMRSFEVGTFKAGETYVLKVQHADIISEFEFTPVTSVDEIPEEEIQKELQEEVAEVPYIEPEEKKDKFKGIWVDWLEPSSIEGKYTPVIEVCAGSQRLVSPEILISSDSEEIPLKLGYVISANSCRQYNHAKIRAIDTDTITVQFVEKSGRIEADLQQQLDSLKEEVTELKERIEKKDAILMEQLKVISDLVSKIKQTVFEPIWKYFTA